MKIFGWESIRKTEKDIDKCYELHGVERINCIINVHEKRKKLLNDAYWEALKKAKREGKEVDVDEATGYTLEINALGELIRNLKRSRD